MITFLPFESFAQSAECLDYKRLGNQRSEAWLCLEVLKDKHKMTRNYNPKLARWHNHPCVKMWDGYSPMLAKYGLAICDEWTSRGYKDQMTGRFIDFLDKFSGEKYQSNDIPDWLGNKRFHESHQSQLLMKNHAFYKDKFDSRLMPGLPYVWPS